MDSLKNDDSINPTVEELVKATIPLETPSGPQCYCGKSRDFSIPDFQCSFCYKWFHINCIKFNIGKALPFMTAYHFMCKNCNGSGEEVFSRKQANFAVMSQTAIANLIFKNDGRVFFSTNSDIIPYLEDHWEELTTQPRKTNNSWYPSITKTLSSGTLFKKYEIENDLYVSLANTDLSTIGPDYEKFKALTSTLKTNISKFGLQHSSSCEVEAPVAPSPTVTQNQSGDERRRKAQNSSSTAPTGSHLVTNEDVNAFASISTNNSSANLVRSTRRNAGGLTSVGSAASLGEEVKPKLNSLGIPIDHPFNKDGYRYILVEPDRNAQGRKLWDESEFTAGKPIPGLFYRVCNPPQVVLSQNDRATHLKLSPESQLAVTGDKGYGSIRATHGTHTGTWYFEVNILEMTDGTACRIGWSQPLANLQAPVGFDKFGYAWRSILGTKFHEACGKHYRPMVNNFAQLPVPDSIKKLTESKKEDSAPPPVKKQALESINENGLNSLVEYHWNPLPETYKDRPLIKFRNCFYFEEKDEASKTEKLLRILPGSKIEFFRNGEPMGTAFEEIYMGTYFPTISVYKNATVLANFGPDLKHLPKEKWPEVKPMSDRLLESDVEQSLSDLVHLSCNQGLVESLLKKCMAQHI
ncbi:Set1/Ash2 histone methyltransferase complex subunit ASH2 [Cichlidogyrus casuarinus]|uniref:Set1/Ash2 histone methyltransferase complex subunit ASH2 n=1 Tax=Cichlidogyrus casuarinus TaxID=1844966 RepID=A0ABD2PWC1_9PLAT